MTAFENYYGRMFTKDQLTPEERQSAQLLVSQDSSACQRCQTSFEEEWRLPNGSFYCRSCIQLGRVRSDQPLYYFPQEDYPAQETLVWKGQLTQWQESVSEGLISALERKETSLVHAVTGAGKTEMMYQVIARAIAKGGAVCIASPRIDVCIELHRRLDVDFSCPVVLLHGSSDPYFRTPLVVATTHQLLKFYQAFDLIIIDEVDSFPYVDNPILYQAVENALKNDGLSLYLTATSTDELDQKIAQGQIKRLSLPRRFHGNPLVVPKTVWCPSLETSLQQKKLPKIILKKIIQQRKSQWPLLLFAAEIETGKRIVDILRKEFPDEQIGFVSSQTEQRLELVEAFRSQKITILVSTTILERGVTFPGVDVMVLEAEHKVYSSSSLIQIAGRAGRSMDRPTGLVLFFSEGNTGPIQKAIQEIIQMNKEAGYE